MPRRNRNALNLKGMNRVERAMYEDAQRATDYRDLRKALKEPPICRDCAMMRDCPEHDGAVP